LRLVGFGAGLARSAGTLGFGDGYGFEVRFRDQESAVILQGRVSVLRETEAVHVGKRTQVPLPFASGQEAVGVGGF
jgi:hypothetical protein